jgi:hypothetical protein
LASDVAVAAAAAVLPLEPFARVVVMSRRLDRTTGVRLFEMHAVRTSLMLAVTMAALALFGAGSLASSRGHAEGGRAALQSARHDDATTVTESRSGPGGTLLHGGRKGPRATPLRGDLGVAILPCAAHLELLPLRGLATAIAATRPPALLAPRLHQARAPPV